MYIVHCGTGTLWFGRSLKSSCPPDSWELMENLEQTISSHSRFWRFWSQCSVLMEPSSEREEAVCGRGAWQGACLPHSRLCPQVGGLTWFTGLLLYPAVVFFLILLSRTFTPTLVSGNAWEKGVHGFTLCPPDYTVSLAPCQLSSDSWMQIFTSPRKLSVSKI